MNLYEIFTQFESEIEFHDYLIELRWPLGVECIFCESEKVNRRTTELRFKCDCCNKSFSTTANTIFHSTKLPLSKWFMAVSIISSAKKGVSSLQLAREIGVNKNTAWLMQMKLRQAMKEDTILSGIVQSDETYIGGALKNMSKKQKAKKNPYKSGMIHKVPVLGMMSDSGKALLRVLDYANGVNIKPIIYKEIDKESTLVTDGFGAYAGADKHFEKHVILNHSKKIFTVDGLGTSQIEGFFSTIKRAVIGQYHKITSRYMQLYMDEINFKFNNKNLDLFDELLSRALDIRVRAI